MSLVVPHQRRALAVLVLACLAAAPAWAQQTAPGAATPLPPLLQSLDARAERLEIVSATHWRWSGGTEIPLADGSKVFADQIDVFFDTATLTAEGNVVLQSAQGQITAARMEFNLRDGTGTFHDATGVMSLGARADRRQFGPLDPDVYFHGERIERLGPRRYRIVRGGFTTCVQPTPRWQLGSDEVALTLNDHAIARNAVLRVKGVPLIFLPFIYYPIRGDDRATGFLMPSYGNSTLRGQALSNGFFWAIGRSQDATFTHDWFTKAGQGFGGEYRFVAGQQSDGQFRFFRFNQKAATYVTDGTITKLPALASNMLTGSATHGIGQAVRLHGRVDYVSDILTQQLYQQNLYRASNPTRSFEGGASGSWGALTTSALYQRTEIFTDRTRSLIYGAGPRVTAAVAPQMLFGVPVYGGVNGTYEYLPYRNATSGVVTGDRSLTRIDLAPNVRVPLSAATFLTVNSSATYRMNYYSRTDPGNGELLPTPFTRAYLSARSEVVGPVVNKIWDTPGSATIDRMKHVIEPAFSIEYVSPVNKGVPVLSDYSDVAIGSTARLTYGVTNRLFKRSRPIGAARGQTREILTIGLLQTYYSTAESGQFDSTYQSAYSYSRPRDLSPVALIARLSPTSAVDGDARLEYDVSGNGLQLVSGSGKLSGLYGSVAASYSWRHVVKTSPADHYVGTTTSVTLLDGRATGTYGLSWDIGKGYVVSQGVNLTYLAQCCGIMGEYQQVNYPQGAGIPIPSDRRVNVGFVLAGLGTFSNFLGAFGGQR